MDGRQISRCVQGKVSFFFVANDRHPDDDLFILSVYLMLVQTVFLSLYCQYILLCSYCTTIDILFDQKQ